MVALELFTTFNCFPVFLGSNLKDRYYKGVSNFGPCTDCLMVSLPCSQFQKHENSSSSGMQGSANSSSGQCCITGCHCHQTAQAGLTQTFGKHMSRPTRYAIQQHVCSQQRSSACWLASIKYTVSGLQLLYLYRPAAILVPPRHHWQLLSVTHHATLSA